MLFVFSLRCSLHNHTFPEQFLTVANRQPHLFCQLLTEIVHPRPQSGCQSVMGFVIMPKCQVDQLQWGYKLKQYSVILVTDHPISQMTRGWTHCLCQALALLTMNHTFPSTLPNEHWWWVIGGMDMVEGVLVWLTQFDSFHQQPLAP